MEGLYFATESPPHLRGSWVLIGISAVKLIPLCDMAPIKQDQMRCAWTWRRSTWSRHVPPPRRSPILFNFGHTSAHPLNVYAGSTFYRRIWGSSSDMKLEPQASV